MEKKNVFCLLFVVFLLLKGVCAYAEGDTGILIDPTETTATLTWNVDPEAQSYQLDIYHDGDVFCKLTLGTNGQLLGISFNTPDRARKARKEANTLSFMVTGLDVASRYNYVLSVLDKDGKPLHVYIGDFATTGYMGELQGSQEVIPTPPIIPGNPEAKTQGMETVTGYGLPVTGVQKMLKGGQLYLMYKGTMYNVQGIEIK